MANWVKYSLFLIFIIFITGTWTLEPISTAIGIGIASVVGGLGYNYEKVVDQTICRMTECCNDRWIVKNFTKLSLDLKEHVFGQPIVEEKVVQALKSHYEHIDSSKKPLVMTFHGTPGTGKNYVADFIVKAIYAKGLDSAFVHRFSGRTDFPIQAYVETYSAQIRDYIKKAITTCSKAIFIFDEVDTMPSGVFDAITALLDHHTHVDNVNYREAVFIFLLNAGGVEIADKLYESYKSKKMTREDMKLYHFESILESSAYNLQGGLKKSRPIEAGLIDHYVPFLPLEKPHIIECIRKEFQRLRIKMTEHKKNEMLEYVTMDVKTNLFANNGCKRISKKAETFV
ncbi:torsin-like protein [Culicoides brevitarsis]|uniref:torsin-like protein n=1 Tax=Culicoides brevitarsis TaxID=469753 RepID=UPI00307B4ACF